MQEVFRCKQAKKKFWLFLRMLSFFSKVVEIFEVESWYVLNCKTDYLFYYITVPTIIPCMHLKRVRLLQLLFFVVILS